MAKFNMFCSGFCTFACVKYIVDGDAFGICVCALAAILSLVDGLWR